MPQSVSLPTNKPGFRLQMGAYPSSEERISQTSWAVVYGGAGSPAVAVGLEFNGKTTMEVGSLLVVPPQGNGTSPPSDGPTVSVVSTIDRLNVTTNASFVVPSFFAVLFTPQSIHTVCDKTLSPCCVFSPEACSCRASSHLSDPTSSRLVTSNHLTSHHFISVLLSARVFTGQERCGTVSTTISSTTHLRLRTFSFRSFAFAFCVQSHPQGSHCCVWVLTAS